MYLQKLRKKISVFQEKRKYLDETESNIPLLLFFWVTGTVLSK